LKLFVSSPKGVGVFILVDCGPKEFSVESYYSLVLVAGADDIMGKVDVVCYIYNDGRIDRLDDALSVYRSRQHIWRCL